MGKEVQFVDGSSLPTLRMLPIGQGFVPDEDMRILNDPDAIRQITNAQERFQSLSLGRSEYRKTRDRKPFIYKSAYVLSSRLNFPNEDEIIALLSDSSTLFSHDYQSYAQDHKFYLQLRRQQKKTIQELNKYCRKQALKGSGFKHIKYEVNLRKIEGKLLQEDWSVEKLENELMKSAVQRPIRDEELNAFFLMMKNSIKEDSVKSAFSFYVPEIELTERDYDRLSDDFLEVLQHDKKDSDRYYKRFLTFHGSGICRAYEFLRGWIPNFRLKPGEAEDFISKVLFSYICARKRLPIEKKAAGHYTPTYRICDKADCNEYLKIQRELTEIRERHKSWKRDTLSSVFKNGRAMETCSIMSEFNEVATPKTAKILPDIFCATKEFFSQTGGHPDKFNRRNVESVISCLEKGEVDMSYFPFCYLLFCVAGTSALFSTQRSVEGSSAVEVFRNPYYQKPSRKKQRISRIIFLDKLNKIMGLDKEKRSHNWNLFLQMHGSVIESPEEAALWHEILCDKNGELEDIPSIELSLLCHERLQQCIPVQEWNLYCYRSSSILQEGGYAKYLKEHPTVVENCITRIKRGTFLQKLLNRKYLKACSGITFDVESIRNICEDLAKSIRWGTIADASNEKLEQFCRSCYNGQNITDDEAGEDITELKNLLVETSLRHILAEEAYDKLRKKAEEVFNRETEFQISLSSLNGRNKGG